MKNTTQEKMRIEIWSDIACPFCYIGKHKIDKAVLESKNSHLIDIVWKSYQLNPDLITDNTKSIYQSLAESKQITIDVAKQMTSGVIEMGKNNGVFFDFDKTIPANTLKSHQLLHFAKKYGKQSEAKEMLFEAYFKEGKNIDDVIVLTKIISLIGLNVSDFVDAVVAETFLPEVELDFYEARQIGVRGVPFFVFNNQLGISGAQDDTVFTNTLNTALIDWQKDNPHAEFNIINGPVCSPKGCE
ncbi:MAG: DsbA family oxidoreductase [Bacteroidota bacterium]|nr:DsbA family oxidoreductase [Bacteroidota bacterium]